MYSIQNEIESYENRHGKKCYRTRKTIAAKMLMESLNRFKATEKEYTERLIKIGYDKTCRDLHDMTFYHADTVKECCGYLDLDIIIFASNVSAWLAYETRN